MNNLVRTQINTMSRLTNVVLTMKHIEVLEYVYSYYEKHKVGPLYRNLLKHTGVNKENLESMFPYGLNSVYTWVGIPIHTAGHGCKKMAALTIDDFRDVYLDHNATTYLRQEVIGILQDFYGDSSSFGNPSSSTILGKKAYDRVHEARVKIADIFGVKSKEIIFTGSGSEANNMAIKGIALNRSDQCGHILSTNIEHLSVMRTLRYLEEKGFEVTYLDAGVEGVVSPKQVADNIRDDTILVTIIAANNEIGTINPICRIGEICKARNVPFMVDAVQAFGKMRFHPKEMGISLLSVSGHKIYAPKGVACLYINENLPVVPLLHGGEQEFGYRAGTENVGSIVAFGEAAVLINREMDKENERLLELRGYFMDNLRKIEPECIVNGSSSKRLPNNLNIGFPGVDSGSLLLSLNHIGVYVSAGSACSAGSREASHVIRALGVDTDRYGIIRFSTGLKTTKEDLDYLFKYLPDILNELKKK